MIKSKKHIKTVTFACQYDFKEIVNIKDEPLSLSPRYTRREHPSFFILTISNKISNPTLMSLFLYIFLIKRFYTRLTSNNEI